jgi:ATP-dependent Clp protease ATP-binding subunit ClpA
VVQKFVMQLETQLSERNVTFDLHEDAISWLAEKGYDEKMGARPLSRVIQENIKKPLANEILFGKLKKGGVVSVTVGKKDDGSDGLILDVLPETAPVKPKPEAELKAAKSPGKASKGKAKPASKAAKANEEADVLVAEADKADEENKPRRKANTVPKVPKKK